MNIIIKNIVVTGGGHAGVEAALAAARLGVHVYLVTMDVSAIGRMSCNPAIGGLAKGHLVREIDALGGVMARAADLSGIQFKTLNTSKGRAVWSSRAQVDKKEYPLIIQQKIKCSNKITIIEDEVVDFNVDNQGLCGVITRGKVSIRTRALVVCSGTFLNGVIHIGSQQYPAGRYGEKPSIGLTHSIVNKGHVSSRLKTGTPPRLRADSIDWSLTKTSFGDNKPSPFSFFTPLPFAPRNLPCHLVCTNENVRSILLENIDHSPMFSGQISATGPRYCPSIEDKIVRFSSKDSHHIFLEPEWVGSNQIYVNGFSTSMPLSVQMSALKQIPALGACKMIRPGYAIEYDYIPSHQLKSTLESKLIPGLYFSGQLNGTSGYEEAAAQGLLAGANAALKILEKDPLVLGRDQAYAGVLIDDLITKDINEPYRMFTSSAEHRLSLRGDNVPLRLGEIAFSSGLISQKQFDVFSGFTLAVSQIKQRCESNKYKVGASQVKITEYLRRPENSIMDDVVAFYFSKKFSRRELFTAETDIKYQGYVDIERARLKKIRSLENLNIPLSVNYASIGGLSAESIDKLSLVRPETLGQASRVAGVRPVDVGIIAVYLKFFK